MSLRIRVLQGGAYLAARQVLGMLVGLGGTLLLTRLLGPSKYGLYAAAYGVYTYLQNVFQAGVGVYLVRAADEPTTTAYNEAFSLLLALGFAGVLVGVASLPFLADWTRLEGVGAVAAALFLCLLPACVSQVPQARLERALDYRRVAWIELAAQAANYSLAVPLAFLTRSVWAPVAGFGLQTALQALLLFASARYRPRVAWSWAEVRKIMSYALGYSASLWIWQLRSLVNPLVVGRLAGAESVGYVSLSVRIVEALSFVRGATWRLSLSVLARVQEDRARLLQAVTEGMNLQVMALAPLMLGFAVAAPWVVPLAFGSKWGPVLTVYPFIAVAYLMNAVFNLHSSTLYVLRRNWDVSLFHAVHVLVFASAAEWLIRRHGLVGYGWAEILAFPSYFLIHYALVRRLGKVRYTVAAIWLLAGVTPLFARWLGPWTWLALPLPLLWSATRRQVIQYAAVLTRRVQGDY